MAWTFKNNDPDCGTLVYGEFRAASRDALRIAAHWAKMVLSESTLPVSLRVSQETYRTLIEDLYRDDPALPSALRLIDREMV